MSSVCCLRRLDDVHNTKQKRDEHTERNIYGFCEDQPHAFKSKLGHRDTRFSLHLGPITYSFRRRDATRYCGHRSVCGRSTFLPPVLAFHSTVSSVKTLSPLTRIFVFVSTYDVFRRSKRPLCSSTGGQETVCLRIFASTGAI